MDWQYWIHSPDFHGLCIVAVVVILVVVACVAQAMHPPGDMEQ